MAKKARVYDGTAWQELASAQTDLTAYSTTAQISSTYSPISTTGLVLITSQTIGTAVSSVVVNNAFSSNYDAYKIIITGGTASATNYLTLKLGASTTGYDDSFIAKPFAAGFSSGSNTNQPSYSYAGGAVSGQSIYMNAELLNPFLAKHTYISTSLFAADTGLGMYGGTHRVATSYTDFTIALTGGGTLTGGTIRVYGYKN